jgi:hypothetical protein
MQAGGWVVHFDSPARAVVAARNRESAHGAIVAPASSCPRAEVLNSQLDVAACSEVPAVAIAVAAPPQPPVRPTPPVPPKPRESTPSTTKTNGTVLHDSAGAGTVIDIRPSDEASRAIDQSGACVPRERDILQVPANGHQIPIRIGPTSDDWATCDCRPSRQAYRAYMCLGLLAEWADCVGSPNGADPRALRAHRLAASTEPALTKLHCGPRGPFRRPRTRARGAFEQLQAVLAQEACDVL